jgi:hypothetical protein
VNPSKSAAGEKSIYIIEQWFGDQAANPVEHLFSSAMITAPEVPCAEIEND